ncbi:MAG: septum formation initiator family protein [Candidatus Eremiobacteraeota bacterium]|nr:septum formation initiator family protein [Candidatus Eremiobacteraeota bacterium]MBV8262741.1 septum formation initiator family protein [Candidatus Eremiobacteraeota bacterium]MBV8669322.1 septum formation initiator family protein [Candidatus Eremiobacteraeota bacterium]
MTPRRGSLTHKIIRFARTPRGDRRPSRGRRVAILAATVAGRSLVVLVALFLSGTIAVQIWHAGVRNAELHRQIHDVESQNADLTDANGKLQTRVVRLHDPEYLVPIIHEQLGLTKPHEVFIQVTQATPAPQ